MIEVFCCMKNNVYYDSTKSFAANPAPTNAPAIDSVDDVSVFVPVGRAACAMTVSPAVSTPFASKYIICDAPPIPTSDHFG